MQTFPFPLPESVDTGQHLHSSYSQRSSAIRLSHFNGMISDPKGLYYVLAKGLSSMVSNLKSAGWRDSTKMWNYYT